MKTALFPGSFDPITKGHEAIVRRASTLFDKIIIGIGVNSKKNYLFPLEQRLAWLNELFEDVPNVEVRTFQKLTVEFCKEIDAQFIMRGLRNSVDFNYEKSIAQMNHDLHPEIETIFLLTTPELSHINSSILREIYINGGDINPFIPAKLQIKPLQK